MPAMAYRIFHRALKLFVVLLFAVNASCAMGPPVQEMSNARQAIRAARDAGAANMSSDALLEAERLLSQAEAQLQSGEYEAARRDAIAARSKAGQALRDVRSRQSDSSG
jgi:hypothetical protein